MLSETFILKNRMRETRSYGSVGGLGREAQVYPDHRYRYRYRYRATEAVTLP